MTDKHKLLDQLRICRLPSEGSGGVAWTATLLIAAVAVVLGAGGTYLLADPRDSVNADAGHRDDGVARPQSIPAPAAPEPERKSGGENDNGQRILEAAGYVAARRIATVSAEITGRIFEVNVEEGTVVEQGQVLAKLDDAVAVVDLELARANVMALTAQLESIAANLAEARRVRARSEELLRRSLISEAEVTRDKATVDALSANLRSAEANRAVATLAVKRQRELLDDHIIRAPFAGVVTDKNAQTGEIVSPNSAGEGFTRSGICTIVDMDSLEIEVDVNEAFIGRVFVGQTVEANLDAYPDWDIPASVIAVIPTADRAKATVRVRIGINERDARILPDMGVKVAFFG
jgi:HlyD family secretion protein